MTLTDLRPYRNSDGMSDATNERLCWDENGNWWGEIATRTTAAALSTRRASRSRPAAQIDTAAARRRA